MPTLAITYKWEIQHFNINNVFLNGLLLNEIYIQQHPDFETDDSRLVCKLNKILYGLKHASKASYEHFTQASLQCGFTSSKCDHLLFIYNNNGISLCVLLCMLMKFLSLDIEIL